MLEQSTAATEAAEKAAQADLLLFSAPPEGHFPAHVKEWVETWLIRRGDREGLLAGLLEPTENSRSQEGQKHTFLRNAAHRGAMDYLTRVPEDVSRSIPDSLDSYTERADQVTSLLDEILRQQPTPPHLLP